MVVTQKWTCDVNGNWRLVPVSVVRQNNGWIEHVMVSRTAQQERKAA